MTESHPDLSCWSQEVENDGRMIVALARHGEGKSTLIQHLCKNVIGNKCHDWVGYAGSVGAESALRSFLPACFVYSDPPSEEELNNCINRQKYEIQLSKQDPTHTFRKLGIVMDDCGYDRNFLRNSKALRVIAMNLRHLGIFIVLSLQYFTQIPPELHTQVDYMFLFQTGDPGAEKSCYEKFFQYKLNTKQGTHFKQRDFSRFSYYMQLYTKSKGVCLVVQRSRSPYICYYEFPKSDDTEISISNIDDAVGDQQYKLTATQLMGEQDQPLGYISDDIQTTITNRRKVRFMKY